MQGSLERHAPCVARRNRLLSLPGGEVGRVSVRGVTPADRANGVSALRMQPGTAEPTSTARPAGCPFTVLQNERLRGKRTRPSRPHDLGEALLGRGFGVACPRLHSTNSQKPYRLADHQDYQKRKGYEPHPPVSNKDQVRRIKSTEISISSQINFRPRENPERTSKSRIINAPFC